MNHILISPQDCESGFLSWQDPRADHIIRVLKIRENGRFRVGVKGINSGIATVMSFTNKGILFTYETKNPADTLLPITLILGGTRPSVLQRLLRDITAFGVKHIIIVHTENSEKSYLLSHLWQNQNYQKHIDEGLSLAQTVSVPHITRTFSLKETLLNLNIEHRAVADQNATTKISDLLLSTPFVIAIGPERGFTDSEKALLNKHKFQPGHFGTKRTLRSENACMIALTLCSHTVGLM